MYSWSENKAEALDPTRFKSAVDASMNRYVGFNQQDAHEFLIDLIDCLHDEMEGCLKDIIGYSKSLDNSGEILSPKRPRVLEDVKLIPSPATDTADFLSDLLGMVAKQANSSNTAPDADECPILDDFLPTSRHFRAEVEESFTCISCGYNRSKKVIYLRAPTFPYFFT